MRLRPLLGLTLVLLNASPAIAIITEEEFDALKAHALALVDRLQAGSPYIIETEAGPDIHMGQEIIDYIQANSEDQRSIYAITLQRVRQTLEALTLAQAQQNANHNYTHTRILLRAAAEESFRSGVGSSHQQNHTEAFEAYTRAAAYYLLRMIYRIAPGNQETMEMGELEVQVEVYLLQAFNAYLARLNNIIIPAGTHNITHHHKDDDSDDDPHTAGAILIPTPPQSTVQQIISQLLAASH